MRILIADDHEIVRKGVRSLLSADPECEVCGEAIDGRDAVSRRTANGLRPTTYGQRLTTGNDAPRHFSSSLRPASR